MCSLSYNSPSHTRSSSSASLPGDSPFAPYRTGKQLRKSAKPQVTQGNCTPLPRRAGSKWCHLFSVTKARSEISHLGLDHRLAPRQPCKALRAPLAG